MRLDAILARLLSEFFLDIAKAVFIATFIAPALTGVSSFSATILLLTRGLASVIVFLVLAWYLASLEKKL